MNEEPEYKSTQRRNDLYRLIIALCMIVVSALLVSSGKLDVVVLITVFSGVSVYYLGKSSDKGSII